MIVSFSIRVAKTDLDVFLLEVEERTSKSNEQSPMETALQFHSAIQDASVYIKYYLSIIIMSVDTSNSTVIIGSELTESEINIILFSGIAVVLVCCVPFLLGKNGPIRSREWFSRKT